MMIHRCIMLFFKYGISNTVGYRIIMGTSRAPVALILFYSDVLEYRCKNVRHWYRNRDRNNHRLRKAGIGDVTAVTMAF